MEILDGSDHVLHGLFSTALPRSGLFAEQLSFSSNNRQRSSTSLISRGVRPRIVRLQTLILGRVSGCR